MKRFAPKLARIATIATAETESFVVMTRLAGLNPARAFRGADLRKVDFGTDDIAGFNFTRALLHGANLSRTQGIDRAIFTNAGWDQTTLWPDSPLRSDTQTTEATTMPSGPFSMKAVKEALRVGRPLPRAWIPNIVELRLGNSRLRNPQSLAELTELRILSLAGKGSRFMDATPLASLHKISHLILSYTLVRDLAALSGLTSLQHLDLWGTKVTDLAPLTGLTALQYLGLGHAKVFDLAPLARLTTLKHLHLSGTQASDLAPLAGLANLQTLYLNSTQVADLAPLAGLANLQYLDLTNLPPGIESALPRRAEIKIIRS